MSGADTRDARSVIVLAEWNAKPGREQAVAAALQELATATREEEGNLDYRIFVDVDVPGSFLLLEEYADAQAVDAHRASTHFQRIAVPVIAESLSGRRARVVIEEDHR